MEKIIFESDIRSDIKVIENQYSRYLMQNGYVQSVHFNDISAYYRMYYHYFHAFPLFGAKAENIFEIGFSGGTNANLFLKLYDDVRYTSVEQDAEIIEVTQEFFDFPNRENMTILSGDGRDRLSEELGAFDLVIVDAYQPYQGSSLLPQSLATTEFFKIVQSKLKKNGLLMMNVCSGKIELADSLLNYVGRTMGTVFSNTYFLQTEFEGQRILVASDSECTTDLNQQIFESNGSAGMEIPDLDFLQSRLRRLNPSAGEILFDSMRFDGNVLRF